MIRHSHCMHLDLIWRRRLRSFLLLFLPLILASTLFAQGATDTRAVAAQELVRTVLTRAGSPSAISLEVRNTAGLGLTEDAYQKLHAQFNAARVQIVSPERALAEVVVTLSEDVHGELWVAEVKHGETRDVAMVRVARNNGAGLPRMTNAMTLRKTLVWSQVTPVLDVALLGEGDSAALLVLDAASVSLYRNRQSHWELEQSAPIASTRPWPRDLRGRLLPGKDHKFDALLPGMKCSGTADSGVTMACAQSDDPWPLNGDDSVRGFFGARNFFTGALAGAETKRNVPPFYSAAFTEQEMDFGQVGGGLANGSSKVVDASSGSDIASVRSECGSGTQVLMTGAGDFTQKDTLRAMDAQNGALVPAASPLEFNGPITALWTAREGKAVTAVSKTLSTGRYEAFVISVTCR